MKSINLKTVGPLIYPLAMLCNTTIGIGMFSLPYVASKVGLPLTAVYFVVLGAVVCVIQLMFAQVCLKTPDYKRLPGFARYHLGPTAEVVVSACVITSLIGVMVAFCAIGGQFLFSVAGPLFGGDQIWYNVVYLMLGSLLILFGINLVEKIEFWGLIFFFLILALLLIKASPFFRFQNLGVQTGGLKDIFLPYGPILFALWGASSIPEVEEMLGRKKKKKYLPRLILISSVISAAVYLVFTVAVVGFTGIFTTESALTGFKYFFDGNLLSLTYAFGLITTFTSFVIVGLTLKKILHYDMSVSKTFAWFVVTFVPLLLLLSGLNNFLSILSFIGGFTLGLEGIIILLMYNKVYPQRKALIFPLLAVMTGGMLFEIIYFFKI